ncbi:hypothetical protein BS47DRAFT_642025 [Hydnum rufescens UP504]|uniref:UPF3 domain-containing protein n=1 Tax=Hydnum rufescens UP504 TaxID=1448309 RepID=A0A9P6BB04_9AGAM|nr:hypothetical protein BS47DRAFT_642025 [Hydnum rufescens UP504]
MDKESVPSRAYLGFKSPEQVAQFSREYDGHLFRDKQGNESLAVVEFAPFQKLPPERKKADTRAGTILQDEDYISFIESLKDTPPAGKNPEIADALAPTGNDQPKSTPLLEALKAEKAAAKDAAQILSYHGHYSSADRRHGASSSSKAAAAAAKEGVSDDDPTVFSRTAPPPTSVDVVAPAAAGGNAAEVMLLEGEKKQIQNPAHTLESHLWLLVPRRPPEVGPGVGRNAISDPIPVLPSPSRVRQCSNRTRNNSRPHVDSKRSRPRRCSTSGG